MFNCKYCLVIVISILLIELFVGIEGQNIECTQFATNSETAGQTLFIPYNSTSTVILPSNFTCNYKINVKSQNWLRITVTNDLSEVSDYILLDDGMNHTKKIDRTTRRYDDFYMISNTTGSIEIHTSENSNDSRILIRLDYFEIPEAQKLRLENDGRVAFLDLNNVLQAPVQVESDSKMMATIGVSGFISDEFDSYYIFDGNLTHYQTIFRLDDYLGGSNVVSSSNTLTLIGLSNLISMSTIVLNRLENVQNFDKIAAVTVFESSGNVKISSSRARTAVTFVSSATDVLLLNSLQFTDFGNGDQACKVIAIAGAPSENYRQLLDFSPSVEPSNTLPQLFPAKYFSMIIDHCSLQITLKSRIPDNYFNVTEGQSGYIYSPSYLDPKQSPEFNVTYAYNSTSSIQFSIDIENVELTNNAELDISVITAELRQQLSIVITGNQTGTKSRAVGNWMNIFMRGSVGNGFAKLKYQISSNSGVRLFGTSFLCLISIILPFL